MKSNKNTELNEKFKKLSENEKMSLLGVTSEIFTTPRFRGVPHFVVVNDLWSSLTSSQRRAILK